MRHVATFLSDLLLGNLCTCPAFLFVFVAIANGIFLNLVFSNQLLLLSRNAVEFRLLVLYR